MILQHRVTLIIFELITSVRTQQVLKYIPLRVIHELLFFGEKPIKAVMS